MKGTAVKLANRRELVLVLAILVVGGYFGARDSSFLSSGNLASIAEQSAGLMVIALGMTAVILVRGIDLSVGASLAVASVCGGRVSEAGGGSLLIILSVLAAATVVGAVNGLLISYAGIAPFMATLGTLGVCTGSALALSGSSSITVSSGVIEYLGFGTIGSIPVAAVIAVVVLTILAVALTKTVWGRHVYATGGSPEAARLALVPPHAIIVSCYVFQGVCVGVAAVLAMGRVGSAQPLVDGTIAFSAISAVIIGGTRLTGGVGTVAGTAVGVLLLGLINVGLAYTNASQELVNVVLGIIVVVAVASTELRIPRGGKATRDTAASPGEESAPGVVLQIRSLSKRFGAVVALNDISFELHQSEVIALLGENGAGKTTLVGAISGEVTPDSGHVRFCGRAAEPGSEPIAVVHQHLATLPDLKVWENLFVGTDLISPSRTFRAKPVKKAARDKLLELGIPIQVDRLVRLLTLGEQQMLEIARAFVSLTPILVLDEPTSAISADERDILHALIKKATDAGTSVVYISHRMRDVFEIADRVIVLRDGAVVADRFLADVSEEELVSLTVGRDVGLVFPHVPSVSSDDDLLLTVRGLSDGAILRDASFEVRRGEMVGVAGLLGSGRSELLRCLAGHSHAASGSADMGGTELTGLSPKRRGQLGVALVPEDRKTEGLVLQRSVRFNVSLPWLRQVRRGGTISTMRERARAQAATSSAGVKPQDPEVPVVALSGGNQQKVLLARWLETNPSLLLLDEPTRGVDVGAKSELHDLINAVKSDGAAVLMVSSELPELLGVCDRVVVMREGVIVGELDRGASEEDVAKLWFSQGSSNKTSATKDGYIAQR